MELSYFAVKVILLIVLIGFQIGLWGVFKKAGFSFPLSLQIRSSNYTNKRVPPYILISFSITFFKLFVGKIQSTFLDHSWTKQNIFYFKKSSYKVSAKVT